MGTATHRQHYRELVAEVAAKAKAKLPQAVNGRLEGAVKLVLLDEVQVAEDGTITVGSCTDPTKVYRLIGTSCECKDFTDGKAPDGWCRHRIAAGIQKRVRELLPQMDQPDNVRMKSPLPEARCSINARMMLGPTEIQLTLRGNDEHEVITRLQTAVKDFDLRPIPKPAPRNTGRWPQRSNQGR